MSKPHSSVCPSFRCLALLAGVLAVQACGDGPTCPSDLVAVIQSPIGNISSVDDANADQAGIQQDVVVRSNLRAGDTFVLTVTDAANAVAQYEATAISEGDVVFAGVTLPAGALSLDVAATSECGTVSDEVEIDVITDSDCALTIDEGPIASDFFAPIPVLNSTNDSSAALPNFQANVSVAAAPGFKVEVFVLDTESGSEASIGTADADAGGLASFEATLAQGRQAVRATCTQGNINEASATHTVQVDTVVPSCQLVSPAQGVTVTPDNDSASLIDGIQMTWTGSVDDGDENDTEGESSVFYRNALEFPGQDIAANGLSSTIDPGEFTAPGTFGMSFVTQDHAGNPCEAGFDVSVIMDGCSVAFVEPSSTVIADSNGVSADGLHTNFVVDIGTDCAGLDTFVSCGLGEVSATVPGDGRTTVPNVKIANNSSSQGQVNCTARVVNSDNFQTSDAQPVTYDTQAPGPVLLFSGGRSCGDSILLNEANDFDNDLSNGFQIEISALAVGATERDVQIINSACNTPSCILSNVPSVAFPITIELGANDIRTIARDAAGNQASTGACNINLSEILVTIDDPAGSGSLSADDGTVNGSSLELTICGTVSLATSDVTLSVDGGAGLATTNVAGAWCTIADVSLSEGNHVLVADAASTLDARVGSVTVNVTVDLTSPDVPGNLGASAPNRQQIDMDWDAVAGAASYEVRLSTADFTDFFNEGSVVPLAAGATSVSIQELRSDVTYFVGVAARDAAGNVSDATTLGPIVPLLDASGIVAPPETSAGNGGEPDTKHFSTRMAGGDFNDDGFADVAVAAPRQSTAAGDAAGVVYIYFGSAAGLATTPGVTIAGSAADGLMGHGMTKIRWSGQAGDDLAIAAHGVGQVFIYHSSTISAALSGAGVPSAPDLTITPGVGSWFAGFGGVGFGYSLAAGQLDTANTREDLIIGVIFGGTAGGVAVVYGEAINPGASIELDENDATSMNGLGGHYFEDPYGNFLGEKVAYLGDTRSGDGVGDLATGYFSDFENAGPDRVIVIRGRTTIPVAGISEITFDTARDLEVSFTSADTTTAFGEHIGSIAGTGGGLRDLVISSALEGTNAGSVYIVDASRTGIQSLTSAGGYITRISGAGSQRFGSAIVNNGAGLGNDIDADGTEDLVLAGGRGAGLGLYVWYGDTLPIGGADVLATTRDYFVDAPASFVNNQTGGNPLSLQADWVGDVNGDGLDDICWGDVKALGVNGTAQEGVFETLFDDGV